MTSHKQAWTKELADAEAECERLREAAHIAPFAEFSMDHRGHTAIVNHTNAWATRGNEWAEACRKRDLLRAALTKAEGGKDA